MNQEERAIPSKRYQLTLEGEDIFLRVEHMEQTTAPALSPMSIELLSGELAKRNIMCKQELLEQCFADATGENMKICTVQDTTIIGTLLDIIMAKDFMNATLKVYPSLDGSNLTPEKILSFLEAKGKKRIRGPFCENNHSQCYGMADCRGRKTARRSRCDHPFHGRYTEQCLEAQGIGEWKCGFL